MAGTYPKDLFKGTAGYYARHRPGYPDAFLTHVKERFQLDGRGRLLDVGCGTGRLTLPLAKHFKEVVAMDPEPEMLAEAAVLARRLDVANVTWVEGGSGDLEALGPRLGTFHVVTMGESFHWMDRDATLQTLSGMVAHDGGIVIAWSHVDASIPVNEWLNVANEVVKTWLGEARRAGSGYYVHPEERHEEVLARSPFKRMETCCFDYRQRRDLDSIVGFLYSTSYASPAVLGEKRGPFERDLRQVLIDLEPSGEFQEEVSVGATLAWRE